MHIYNVYKIGQLIVCNNSVKRLIILMLALYIQIYTYRNANYCYNEKVVLFRYKSNK